MRDITFRGKRADNGEWVYGSLLIVNINGQTAYMIYGSDFRFAGERVISGSHALVVPETVGQCVGMTDRNCRKIFEGDIIENHDFNAEDGGYGVVEYNDGAFEINGNDISSTFHENYWGKECEVIGNVHDDPELLGGEDDETD